jgi:hypothetical protein
MKNVYLMKGVYKIIKEEYLNFIKEYEDDIDYSYFEREDELKGNMFSDFLYKNNPEFTKHIPWKVIPFPRLKKIWEDYMYKGIVRDERGMEMIKEIMINNTMKINIMTNLAGHTQWGDEEAFQENIGYWVDEQLNCIFDKYFDNPNGGYKQKENTSECNTQIHQFAQKFIDENYNPESMDREDIRNMLYDEMKERFFKYYMEDPEHKMGGFISDYGLKPLVTLLGQLVRNTTAEQDVVTIDKMLNVVHQRSDIASWFVEGGSRALSQLSGYSSPDEDSKISGSYRMSDY